MAKDASKTPIFHITHINNLESILKSGGLYCNKVIREQKTDVKDISFENIQGRRESKQVPIPPFETLHHYVPFYFAPRSPMLYTINQGNVPQYQDGQGSIIYLVSSVQNVEDANIPFVFTDGHAIMSFSEFYSDLQDLDKIDWNVMQSNYWFDTPEHPDRRRKRQAEFLLINFFPLKILKGIGVINAQMKEQVECILQQNNISVPVAVVPKWYY